MRVGFYVVPFHMVALWTVGVPVWILFIGFGMGVTCVLPFRITDSKQWAEVKNIALWVTLVSSSVISFQIPVMESGAVVLYCHLLVITWYLDIRRLLEEE